MNMETESSHTDETPTMEENPQQQIERAAQAHETVKKYALGSMAIAAVPLPLVDLAAVTGLQVKMLHC
ncbi:MAG: hypothetical protein ABFS56_13940 [Pseudomonadota bacterium]